LPPLVRPVITPRFVPTCSPELLAGLGKLAAEHKAYVTTHGAESLDEVAYVEALHPGEGNDTAILDKHGLLGRRSVIAHCVHLTAAERTVFAAAGATVASCPLSNFVSDCSLARCAAQFAPLTPLPSSSPTGP